VLGNRCIEREALRVAGARGRGIALLWHRIRPEGPRPHEVVRSVSTSAFARQLDVVQQLGDIVPLAELERPHRGLRPRFALTFDDDDPGHANHALPFLLARGLPATFFLSGRWRSGLGPYWWEILEVRMSSRGIAETAVDYGLPPETGPGAIASAVTGTAGASELAEAAIGLTAGTMTAEQAHRLTAAGMEVGFHTVQHPSLPRLDDVDLRTAVLDGRKELADELGAEVRRFAYPHGHVDARVARLVRVGGYRSAWTTAKRVIAGDGDPMLHGRWDVGLFDEAGFRAVLVRGLARPWR
jgi:peptidoglycan/xylan/chitin deacetylase (PgdA/CDA1 family)